ncbi:hypothetical protein GGR54DRAFT_639628 [Hypoxylon sp. NC1633]|nr:hypothetical protein GGR54DRAFT_639628 [Hypoxylon sp. NC1633]
MAKRFNPRQYVPSYEKANDLEHVVGTWVHPKTIQTPSGYAEDEVIVSITGIISPKGGMRGVRGEHYGPGNELNNYSHQQFEDISGEKVELSAACHTLWGIWAMRDMTINNISGSDVKRVIIKSDSDFLSETLAGPGFESVKLIGSRIPSDIEWSIHRFRRTVPELEKRGVEIFFWHVQEEDNQLVRLTAEAVTAPSSMSWTGSVFRVLLHPVVVIGAVVVFLRYLLQPASPSILSDALD